MIIIFYFINNIGTERFLYHIFSVRLIQFVIFSLFSPYYFFININRDRLPQHCLTQSQKLTLSAVVYMWMSRNLRHRLPGTSYIPRVESYTRHWPWKMNDRNTHGYGYERIYKKSLIMERIT